MRKLIFLLFLLPSGAFAQWTCSGQCQVKISSYEQMIGTGNTLEEAWNNVLRECRPHQIVSIMKDSCVKDSSNVSRSNDYETRQSLDIAEELKEIRKEITRIRKDLGKIKNLLAPRPPSYAD